MLLPPDAELVQRDGELPGLALLLDPEALAAQLGAAYPASTIQNVRMVYVRYKPATNCLVTYQVTSPATAAPTYLYGVAFRHDEVAKLAKAAEKRYATGPLGVGALVDRNQALVLYGFPNDRRLRQLRRLQDGAKRQSLLSSLAPEHPALTSGTLTTLRYKPERRWVARLDGTEQSALLRLYAEEEFASAATNHQAIRPTAHFCTPQVLGLDNDSRALLLTWLPGQPLEQQMVDPSSSLDTLGAVGRALAALHAQPVVLPQHYTPAAESAAIQAAAQAVAALVPTLADRTHRLAIHLARHLAAEQPAPVVIHGDFSADQVLLRESNSGRDSAPIALLDFDRAGWGDPAADLGAFAANLYQRAQRGQVEEAQVKRLMAALVDGYQAAVHQPVSSQRIQLHTAIRLLRLAPEAFRQRWTDTWPAAIDCCVQQAEELSYHV